ncbi:3-dehydroquinate synthase [Salinibacillus kushneri]|uniref:3-dehydroquinate synthase n=1 Tax=Salinibacillus kushneri TaxID=237682 RepID=A0A1I0I3K6_9BACI|nr:3-dehydroquinate synthase [Salinibacillus kushneri]SET90254.1 3-dehydroquinate synthase [Salinibacillus kushneri]
MRTLEVNSSQWTYNVYIGPDLRFEVSKYLPNSYDKILIVTDRHVEQLGYLNEVISDLQKHAKQVYSFTVPAGEESKKLDVFEQLQTDAIKKGLDRKSLIVALGGGVVGDLTGFVAATFMRGIDYIQVPTTILAHDSSVGGKVAINHSLGKNLIGAFHAPKGVIYDLSTIKSLPLVEKRSGFAEVIKHGLIADKNMLNQLMEHVQTLETINQKILEDALYNGIKIKAHIVEQDEKEKGIRSHLNFGHTLGHAIEAEAGYGSITHGEAVAIGMLFALQVSESHLSLSFSNNRFKNWLKQLAYPLHMVKDLQIESLIERMKVDKKNQSGQIRMVLLKDVGMPELYTINENRLLSELKTFINEVIE